MELKHLRYFLAVADLNSFSRAASHLNISQPALSRQIKKFEEELHAALFYRDGRGAHLTEAGSELYSHAIRITDRANLAVKAVHKHRNIELSEISVGAPRRWGRAFWLISPEYCVRITRIRDCASLRGTVNSLPIGC